MRIAQEFTVVVECDVPDDVQRRDDEADLRVRSGLDIGFGADWQDHSLELGDFTVVSEASRDS